MEPSPVEVLNNLIGEMIEKRKATLLKKIVRYPKSHFIASDIHECDRYMVHSVLDWKDRIMHDEGLQAIFDAGNREEASVKARIAADGWDLIEQQTPFEIQSRDKKIMCRGKIDGKIVYKGRAIPCEIKSMDGNIFRGITSLDDFCKKPHLRKYLRQMQLYLFGNNSEAGLFILSNFRQEKYIPVVLDYGECERILQKIERNWKMVEKKEYPDRTDDCSLCQRCPFNHICLPSIKNEGTKIINNEELEKELDRREELSELSAEYDSIDKHIKEAFRGVPDALIGLKWRVIGKEIKGRHTIDEALIPPEMLDKVTKKGEPGWKISIIKMEEKKKP